MIIVWTSYSRTLDLVFSYYGPLLLVCSFARNLVISSPFSPGSRDLVLGTRYSRVLLSVCMCARLPVPRHLVPIDASPRNLVTSY